MADFEAVTASIAGSDDSEGLLARAVDGATDTATATRLAELGSLHAEFIAEHERVRDLAAQDYNEAIQAAVTDETVASAALDEAIEREIENSRSILTNRADAASRQLRTLPYLIFIATLVSIGAVAAGMWPRIKEYR
jgi:hypothetical protein